MCFIVLHVVVFAGLEVVLDILLDVAHLLQGMHAVSVGLMLVPYEHVSLLLLRELIVQQLLELGRARVRAGLARLRAARRGRRSTTLMKMSSLISLLFLEHLNTLHQRVGSLLLRLFVSGPERFYKFLSSHLLTQAR